MRNFRELRIWQDALDYTTEIYQAVENFPKRETYGLVSQITRSAVSIPSNIAEGCRGSDKELVYFLNIALGSSFELETQLAIAHRVGFLEKDVFENLCEKLTPMQRGINAFRNSVKYKR